jgi:hypothetical protein
MPNPNNVIGKGRPFKRGQSGNTKGRPKKIPGLDELLAKILGEQKDGMTAVEIILKSLRAKAVRGDVACATLLLDRFYGKVRQQFDITTKDRPLENLITKIEIIKTVRHEDNSFSSSINTHTHSTARADEIHSPVNSL